MKRRLATGFAIAGLCATAALAGEAWVLDVGALSPEAEAHLACMMAHPSREGPEACGLQPFDEPCDDTACLWRHLEGWRGLIRYFGAHAPRDLADRLSLNPAVPTFLHGPVEPPEVTLAAIDRDCPRADVGVDMLEACLFDAANTASVWLDLYQWYHGLNPRLRGTDQEPNQ